MIFSFIREHYGAIFLLFIIEGSPIIIQQPNLLFGVRISSQIKKYTFRCLTRVSLSKASKLPIQSVHICLQSVEMSPDVLLGPWLWFWKGTGCLWPHVVSASQVPFTSLPVTETYLVLTQTPKFRWFTLCMETPADSLRCPKHEHDTVSSDRCRAPCPSERCRPKSIDMHQMLVFRWMNLAILNSTLYVKINNMKIFIFISFTFSSKICSSTKA